MSKPTGKVGKKLAVYLPKSVARAAGLMEGDKVEFEAGEGSVALTVIRDPLELALHGEKFATLTAEEVEEISMKEQERHAKGTA